MKWHAAEHMAVPTIIPQQRCNVFLTCHDHWRQFCTSVLLINGVFCGFQMGWTTCSVVTECRLDDPGFESRQAQEIIPCSKTSRPALRPTHPPVQWIPVAAFCRRGVRITSHIHLKLWLKMCAEITPRTIFDSTACRWTNVPFFFPTEMITLHN
jgi:hypothetical protein